MRGKFVVGAALVLAASAGAALAQQTTVIKPDFMVVVDVSGSMSGTLTNTCGFTPGNRLTAAKCVLGRIINGTGDARSAWGGGGGGFGGGGGNRY